MAHILLVDGSPVVYSVYHAIGHLSYKGEPTGLRFGFLKNVLSYTKKQKVDRVVICWDTPGIPTKAQHLPDYKSNRKESDSKTEMYSQVPALRHLIGLTRWSQAEAEGFEADDVIAGLCRKLVADGHEVTIISPDSDLLQLINSSENVKVWWPPKKQNRKGYESVYSEYGFSPSCLAIWKSFIGDTSDNIKGVGLTVNEKEQLAKTLGKDELSELNLDQFYGNLLNLEPSDFSRKLLDIHIKYQASQNYMAVRLVSPENLSIMKGTANKEELQERLREIACSSLLKIVDDFLIGYGGASKEMEIQTVELQRSVLGVNDPVREHQIETLKEKILSGDLNVQLDEKGNVSWIPGQSELMDTFKHILLPPPITGRTIKGMIVDELKGMRQKYDDKEDWWNRMYGKLP